MACQAPWNPPARFARWLACKADTTGRVHRGGVWDLEPHSAAAEAGHLNTWFGLVLERSAQGGWQGMRLNLLVARCLLDHSPLACVCQVFCAGGGGQQLRQGCSGTEGAPCRATRGLSPFQWMTKLHHREFSSVGEVELNLGKRRRHVGGKLCAQRHQQAGGKHGPTL